MSDDKPARGGSFATTRWRDKKPFELFARGNETEEWRAQGDAIPTVTIRGVVHLAAWSGWYLP
jgi:hypothetical protein